VGQAGYEVPAGLAGNHSQTVEFHCPSAIFNLFHLFPLDGRPTSSKICWQAPGITKGVKDVGHNE
jgi:hypothetical protein